MMYCYIMMPISNVGMYNLKLYILLSDSLSSWNLFINLLLFHYFHPLVASLALVPDHVTVMCRHRVIQKN